MNTHAPHTRILLVGDTHGDMESLWIAIHVAKKFECTEIIVLGDFGVFWDGTWDKKVFKLLKLLRANNLSLKWIDGNHENFHMLEGYGIFDPQVEELAPVSSDVKGKSDRFCYIPRGTLLTRGPHETPILCIGGAYSVDKKYRREHVSWWPQEEVTMHDLGNALSHESAQVVLSHDLPDTGFRAAMRLGATNEDDFEHLLYKNDAAFPEAKRNRGMLEFVLDKYIPALWVHGHYHTSYQVEAFGTRFVGLANNGNYNDGAHAVLDVSGNFPQIATVY